MTGISQTTVATYTVVSQTAILAYTKVPRIIDQLPTEDGKLESHILKAIIKPRQLVKSLTQREIRSAELCIDCIKLCFFMIGKSLLSRLNCLLSQRQCLQALDNDTQTLCNPVVGLSGGLCITLYHLLSCDIL